MRKLTNVYIEVTSRNVNELMKLINRYDLKPNTYIFFNYECISSSATTFVIPKNRKKVKLSVLKHLVDTIPTREEIISLKRQIGGYKTSLLSKEGVIEDLHIENEKIKSRLHNSLNVNNDLYNNIDNLITKIEQLEEMHEDVIEHKEGVIEHLEKKLDIQADLIRDKNAQLEKLKKT